MTAILDRPPRERLRIQTTAVVAGGLALLVARPLLAGDGRPTATLITIFVTLLAVGACWPLAAQRYEVGRSGSVTAWSGLALGIGAFGLGRLLGGGHPPVVLSARIIALNTLAAVAEEAFFRRLTFALIRPGGAALAVVGSALLFAVAHVTVYGWWVLPIDLAAGLVLGWQRQATGRWWVPALTHVVANVLVVL